MPIYEYKCEDCGAVNDVLVRNTETQANVVCPGCKSANITRLISALGAVRSKGGSVDMPAAPSCPNRDRCGMNQCPGAFNR